jgi:metal-sulfur cluster biosynthetic enzyme
MFYRGSHNIMKTCSELSLPHELAIRSALIKVIDPEVGVNIVDLGLVYGIDVQGKHISINLTMTSPACPMGEMLLEDLNTKISHDFPEASIDIQLVWEPEWNPEMMSADAKASLEWE